MKTLILANQLKPLKNNVDIAFEHFRYLNLSDDKESFEICRYLSTFEGSEELPKRNLLRDSSPSFRNKYIEFIGQLNLVNNSLLWWAMSFTNKVPYGTNLCRNTAYFMLITDLLHSDPSPLVVITDIPELCAQLAIWGEIENVQTADLVKAPRPVRRFLKSHTPAGNVLIMGRLLLFWFLSRKLKCPSNSPEGHTVIATQTHMRSFTSCNGYDDAYFGPLVIQENKVNKLVVGLISERPLDQFKKIKALRFGEPMISFESCLTLIDFLKAVFQVGKLYSRGLNLRGSTDIDGLSIQYLVNSEINNSRNAGELLFNLHFYYCAKRLSQNIRISHCLYPFENRSWEKMLIMGLRDGSPSSRLVGYQHAAVTLGHTNFILIDGEASVLPLPDAVLTTGEITKGWFEQEGNFPDGVFKTGCALRQSDRLDLPIKKQSKKITNILFVLATSLQEYANAILLIEPAFVVRPDWDIQIRPHPSLWPLEYATDIIGMEAPWFFSENTGPLSQALEWADVVLYSSSTVGIEALLRGIPVIYVDLGFFLDTDPLFDWNEFKWHVRNPTELEEAVVDIDNLSEQSFVRFQQAGIDYANSYLKPISKEAIDGFWNS